VFEIDTTKDILTEAFETRHYLPCRLTTINYPGGAGNREKLLRRRLLVRAPADI